MSTTAHFDVTVVGAGPAGWVTALALAHSGLRPTLIAAPHRPSNDKPDTRTAALFDQSITFLRNLGCWEHVKQSSAPIHTIRLIDDTGRLFKAPQIELGADELGLQEFGFNVPQMALVEGLHKTGEQTPSLTVMETKGVTRIELSNDSALLHLREGQTIQTQLIAAADGRKSICRQTANITTKAHNYAQAALACTFSHTRTHNDVSTEFHRTAGPCTTVPLPGRNSSLVWVERPETARRLSEIPETEFAELLERRLHGLLGAISDISPRVVFPLSLMTASPLAKNRIALIGEAGHVVPPIGAQGLNMSLRDAATLSDILQEHLASRSESDADLGSDAILNRYHESRAGDVTRTSRAVDLLNQSLIAQVWPLGFLRGLGLHVLNAPSPIRRMLMREGMAPRGNVPRLMRQTNTHQTPDTSPVTQTSYPQGS